VFHWLDNCLKGHVKTILYLVGVYYSFYDEINTTKTTMSSLNDKFLL
jgi:hypothetical protein